MEHIISVDSDKCVGCSMCIKDCPQNNIFLNKDKKAVVKNQNCIKCGHCSAVCPMEAISISGYSEPPRSVENLEKVTSEMLMNSIISRRSIRQFKKTPVSDEDLMKIIEAGRWTPTAKNSQDVEYIIIDKDKRKLEKIAVSVFRKLIKMARLFNRSFKEIEIDDNFFFKNAPVAIAVVSENDINGSLAASNMSLMAESLGLGVLYSGFFSFAVKLSGKLKRELDLKKGKKVVTTLVLGYPDVKYKRSVQKEKAKVTFR